jgi:tetratricopeptide (TPR) repeat protein
MKDAHYKIGMCYWLNGNISDAQVLFKQARAAGKEATEADKYAARSLAESELPNVKLTQARYSTDGGYYAQADALLQNIGQQDLPTLRDKVEYTYRKARLAHKTNQLNQAKEHYQQTIKQNGEEPWYFAPNACLQLGYIYRDENNLVQAKASFKKALEYKRHEYKNSIDSKAKSALAQLDKRK